MKMSSRIKARRLPGLVLAAVVIVAMTAPMGASATVTKNAVIDFEGLSGFVSSVSSGSGISGDAISGSVAVWGTNPSMPASNAALIFDATCGGLGTSGCTGDDTDLHQPANGNVLIITEDFDATNPDDADLVGAMFTFDFSGFGPGVVTVDSLDVLDVESEESALVVEAFSGGAGGTSLGTASIGDIGDGNIDTLGVGISGVDYLEITINGSGAIDNLRVSVEERVPGTQGCTPGYWKNHTSAQDWGGLSPGDDFDATFGVDAFDPDRTLLEALSGGGGGLDRLGRHATAALLNASNGNVDYEFTEAEVIAAVQDAIATGDLSIVDDFEEANELGCPLDGPNTTGRGGGPSASSQGKKR